MSALWTVRVELSDPVDPEASWSPLIGVYSSEAQAIEARDRAAQSIAPDEVVEWFVEPVTPDSMLWKSGFFDSTIEE